MGIVGHERVRKKAMQLIVEPGHECGQTTTGQSEGSLEIEISVHTQRLNR